MKGNRPTFSPEAPPDVVALAQECWDADASKRPTFTEIIVRLEVGFG